ncbi:hypothetical protein FB451DRAFT_1406643 [Mycena latifolia]|nr:hypothetical protein FB451DRAFT_1406643 [Mycena latifolia]
MSRFIPSTPNPLLLLALSLHFVSGTQASVIIIHEETQQERDDRRTRSIIGLAVAGATLLLIGIAWAVFAWRKKRARERAWTSLESVQPMTYQGEAPQPTFAPAPFAAQGPYAPPPTGYGPPPAAYMPSHNDRDPQSMTSSRAPSPSFYNYQGAGPQPQPTHWA